MIGPVAALPTDLAGADQSDDERLARFEDRMSRPILVSALLPILFAITDRQGMVNHLVLMASWLVFVVDLAVHLRLRRGYLRTGWGRFDLVLVVLTAPWFLIPGLEVTRFASLARVARLARIVKASGAGFSRLFSHLGKVGLYTMGIVVICGYLAYQAEHPVNDLFASYRDAVWWSVVTLTTVGYGDIFPITTTGRLMGVVLMLSGLVVLGVLAGALASFFGFADSDAAESEAEEAAAADRPAGPDLDAQLAALRSQVATLDQAIAAIESERARPAD
jgi:voltage-gated potassium channel